MLWYQDQDHHLNTVIIFLKYMLQKTTFKWENKMLKVLDKY